MQAISDQLLVKLCSSIWHARGLDQATSVDGVIKAKEAELAASVIPTNTKQH